jgi:hypothetical protein
MGVRDQSTPTLSTGAPSLGPVLRAIVRHRWVQTAAALWIVGHIVVLWLARKSLPFDRPAFAQLPFAAQIAAPTVGLIEIFVLMVLAFLLTRKRVIPDMAARAPDRRVAWRETVLVLSYALVGQIGGWIVAPALGYHAFSFHLAGTLFGHTMTPAPTELWIWAVYNFLVFAVAPYIYFRRLYTDTALNLHSTNRQNDIRLILVVLAIESAFELSAFPDILKLNPRQLVLGAPLSFAVFFIGTVLPTMVLIYVVLLPRYLKLTGSAISTVLLGGVTYAAMHLVEGWSAFDSPRHVALSLLFVLFQYLGPGMMKSVLTLRTGNAWVHALGYHAVAPHVIVDTPLVVKMFGIT